jgi:hypothetical protein
MHALDLENYIDAHPGSALAELAGQGVRYTSASSSTPSDSFPGLLAMVTGGSPVSTGVFYDVTNPVGFDATVSVVCTAENDARKVRAVINEIHGLDHGGRPVGIVPAIFGMNFQAVSVGQKVTHDNPDITCNQTDAQRLRGKSGGYLDAAATPTEVLEYGLDKSDAALQEMIDALKQRGFFHSTLVIVTAKHARRRLTRAGQ